ncbi:MAG TPA: replication-associated recombination protein A [Gemmatimonadales bacterium]|nr:replication-associated recombination protein A [Gemmatimonadales bacterium]
MKGRRRPPGTGESLFSAGRTTQPLAARMRPRTLEEFVGQEHVLAPGKPLREAIERGVPGSLIFWGPPGSGKTTLAGLVATSTARVFVPFSAVTEGVPRIREIVGEARARLESGGAETILFVDEIHRLNKAQQDSLLPPAEDGTITLIGATTENPSFEINGALLSRTRVFVLRALEPAHIEVVLRRALEDADRGLGGMELRVHDEALRAIAVEADGDARRALTVLEAAAAHVGAGGEVTVEAAREAMQKRFARYDKAGEEHFNLLSAYHKSLRGSDPQGALYWMARMIDGGEDPMTLFRRAIAMAAEDIGLADPNALVLAVAARDAFHMLGPPEGYLPLAEMTIYLATAPKSNSAKAALGAALAAAQDTPAAPVPLHIRNAPTGLMKELGYGKGYRYAHDSPDAYLPQEYLPDELGGTAFYAPGPFGYERKVAERMDWWERKKREGAAEQAQGDAPEADGDPPGESER